MGNLVSHPMISVAKTFSAKGLFQVSVCELNLKPHMLHVWYIYLHLVDF